MLDYSVDWSRFLGSDTISSVTWYVYDENDTKQQLSDSAVVNGLQFVTGTLSGQVATARFSLGTNNVRYTVVCRINTGQNLQYERSIFLRVKEK
jgi:alpha-D-ribose 1-methylphosphonate 5-triphosphate synthase subunit PhnH